MANINELLYELQTLAHDYSFPRLAEIASEIKSSLPSKGQPIKAPVPEPPVGQEASPKPKS
jgi:hypothetical protein